MCLQLRSLGYPIVGVDEFYTSKKCPNCLQFVGAIHSVDYIAQFVPESTIRIICLHITSHTQHYHFSRSRQGQHICVLMWNKPRVENGQG
jgi:hypothetical protein